MADIPSVPFSRPNAATRRFFARIAPGQGGSEGTPRAIPRTVFHRAVEELARRIIRVPVQLQAEGLERIPRHGPVILVINHINFLDPLLAYLFTPRYVVGFTKEESFQESLAPLFHFVGAIPVRRGTVDRTALQRALAVLERGEALLISPEGTRSGHGRLQQAKTGVVLLALASGAPLLPMAIWGQERFWQNLRRLRRTRVWIRVGHPFYLRADGERLSRREREAILREVMGQLAALLPPPYRGVYADMQQATEHYLLFPPGSESNRQWDEP